MRGSGSPRSFLQPPFPLESRLQLSNPFMVTPQLAESSFGAFLHPQLCPGGCPSSGQVRVWVAHPWHSTGPGRGGCGAAAQGGVGWEQTRPKKHFCLHVEFLAL